MGKFIELYKDKEEIGFYRWENGTKEEAIEFAKKEEATEISFLENDHDHYGGDAREIEKVIIKY